MNRADFLRDLTQQLKNLPGTEIEKLINFYDEMIQDRVEDGMSEDEAVESIGSVMNAAEAAMQDVSLPALMKARVKKSREKSPSKALWLTLVILGFPIWLPLLLIFFIAFFIIYLSLWILTISFYIIEFIFAVCSIGGIVMSIVYTFKHSIPIGICLFGFSLVLGAIAIAGFEPAGILTKKLSQGSVMFIKKVKSLFINREVSV